MLKDHLFHGSRKSIRDSLKYCFAYTSIDYIQFLDECRKSEEEGKAGQARAPVKAKVRAAEATLPPKKMGCQSNSSINSIKLMVWWGK